MQIRQALVWIGWMLLGAALVLPVLAWQGNWFNASHWPIRSLRVESEGRSVSVAEIRARVAAVTQTGFFGVNLADVRAAVMQNPWVERVEVRRQFPDRLVLRVDERQPIASFGQAELLSSRGDLFAVPKDYWPENLPKLDGPASERVRVYNFWREAEQRFQRYGLSVVVARMSGRGAYELELNNGCLLLFARQPRLDVLDRFLPALDVLSVSERDRLAKVDLRYANGYVVVWRPPPKPETEPTVTPAEPAAPVVPPDAPKEPA
ncbi:hypothetical protein C7S18_01320 [Ahniella affigens]|uniref:Cell division protein FtsQ n=1 Tax=Ahniella affigens TaxID=2021234 RepID=A0A2P1PM48_9GAMM|nr:FtsQ-type POTRA domain-containing protein [Ahniella affigens]AVP95920.1 hypothetical protein C7S18_01320 [Ahniella affigens]